MSAAFHSGGIFLRCSVILKCQFTFNRVSFEEILFGDNDNLSAIVADLSNSDALIILTDIDGYYDSDPKQNEDARLVCRVKEITTEMIEAAGGTGSNRGTGGMHTKLEAALFATNRGIAVNVMSGDNPALLYDLFDGHSVGTFFEPKAK